MTRRVREYDVFISHASEDKTLAKELYKKIRYLRLKAWIDEGDLRIGDSLLATIGHALTKSRFGVPIVSKHYLRKAWAQEEMKVLLHLQFSSGRRMILPIWHNIGKNDIKVKSPFLMDIEALSTSRMSLDNIAREISHVAHSRLSEYEPQLLIAKNNALLFTPDKKKVIPTSPKRSLKPTSFKFTLRRTAYNPYQRLTG